MVRVLTHALSHPIHEGPPTTYRIILSKWDVASGFSLFHKLCTPGFEP
jgi:hypothetical protein